MAKRFTDTEKWKDDWFICLDNDSKIAWQWIVDNCTYSGICKRSMGLLNMMCKTSFTEERLLEIMEGRVVIHGNNWFVPKFIKFQYSTLLSAKPAILSVVKDIFDYKLKELIPESYGNDYIIIEKSYDNHCKMIKDKVKDKDKDKDKEINGHKKIFGKEFNKNKDAVIFDDGSIQKLGMGQLFRIKQDDLQPEQVFKGLIS